MAYVIDPVTQQVWSASISTLPQALFEQLQSTNMEFVQRGETLYVIGGYGYSPTASDHITYPNLTAIDLPGAMDAIRNGETIAPFFRQIIDPRMEVTGGQLGRIADHFFLVGGQRFIGRYNPMGPDFGPGFVQEYTNAIRKFRIDDDGTNMTIADYTEVVDTMELHRRDYNMVPQVFPDGSKGYTVFSGVFQYAADVPWLNTVDINGSGWNVVPVFEQLLNQYHTAHAALGQHREHDGYGLLRWHWSLLLRWQHADGRSERSLRQHHQQGFQGCERATGGSRDQQYARPAGSEW